jgi:Domain of unknown function DUF29
MSELYETDIVVWSEHQAAQLHEQVHAVTSLLRQAMAHRLKAMGWPHARDVPNWQADARRFAIDAADRFTPSMRQRLDVARNYRRALRTLPDSMDASPPMTPPAECPWSLDELLAEDAR